MYKNLFCLFFLIVTCACENTAEESRRFSAYYDVDSLINAQLVLYSDMSVKVQKTAELNSATDTTTYFADSLRLAQELNVFRKANINKPAFEGLYSQSDSTSDGKRIVTYEPVEEDNDLEVKYLQLTYSGDHLIKVDARVEEDHWLYDSRRILQLELNPDQAPGFITNYFIEGTQKMILRDRSNFIVEADIMPEGFSN